MTIKISWPSIVAFIIGFVLFEAVVAYMVLEPWMPWSDVKPMCSWSCADVQDVLLSKFVLGASLACGLLMVFVTKLFRFVKRK